MKTLVAVGLLGLVAAGCVVTHEAKPPGLDGAIATRTAPTRAWKVVADGEALGVVVLYADAGEDGLAARQYYSVRNGWHQELGTVDALGRAYRHVPHEREARWVGTGTLLEGTRAVLGAGPSTKLVEVPIRELRVGRVTKG